MGDDGFYTVLQELKDEVEELKDRLEDLEDRVDDGAPLHTLPVLPTPRTDREFELDYKLMHPTPGGNPRCTW